MNDVIKKVVDELAKEAPRLDYVRGMLDTLLSMSAVPTQKEITKKLEYVFTPPLTDEGDILDAKASAAVKRLPPVVLE